MYVYTELFPQYAHIYIHKYVCVCVCSCLFCHTVSLIPRVLFFSRRALFSPSLSLSHFLSSSHLLPSSLSFVLDPLSLAVFHTLSFFFENEFPLFLSFIFPSPSVFSSLPFILRHPLLPLLFSLVLRRPCLLQNPATKSAMPSSKSNNKERDAFFKIQQESDAFFKIQQQRERCVLQNPTRER